MEQSGQYTIAAPAEKVWAALNDPQVLGACITGCQEITKIDDEHFAARVKAKIGPVSATFQAALELINLSPPSSYTIQGSVKGGPAGFAKGSADVKLEDEGERTQLSYSVKANVGGKLAQVGSRLVDGAARKMAEDFFAAFTAHVGEAQAAVQSPGGDTENGEFENKEVGRKEVGRKEVGRKEAGSKEAEKNKTISSPQLSVSQAVDKQDSKRKYESSGNGIIWGIAFVVLALAIILAV